MKSVDTRLIRIAVGSMAATVTRRKNQYGEHVVRFFADDRYVIGSDYFATDLRDAVNTALTNIELASGFKDSSAAGSAKRPAAKGGAS